MIGYRIKERLKILRMELGLSAEERAQWTRTKRMLSNPEYGRFMSLAAGYLTVKGIEEREKHTESVFSGKEIPAKDENVLILPNPYALADTEAIEKRMETGDLKIWLEMKDALASIKSPALSEIVRRYIISGNPPQVNIIAVSESAKTI